MAASQDAAALSARIEEHIQRLEAQEGSPIKAEAQSLVRLLMSLYGTALSRILEIVRTERGGPAAVFDRLASDPLVASLLVLHDLHPVPLDVRVARALATLQPHLPPGTTVQSVGIDDDAVSIRLDRDVSARGSGSALRAAIERAIREAAPELNTIRFEGVADAPEQLIQVIRRPARAEIAAKP